MWLLHSLEGPDQVVQVSGDVVHGELQTADDFIEAKHNTHVQLMTLVCVHDGVEQNRSRQMQLPPKMEEEHRPVETKERVRRYAPAGELFHGDPFLDDMLSARVNQRQSRVLRWLVLGCHLVEEATRVTERITGQRSS